MTTVRVTCPECGDIELCIADLLARVCIETNHAEYRFTCDSCQMIVIKDADDRTRELLVSGGVRVETWHLPAELKESRDGLVINHDDLIEFHNLIENETGFAAAIAALQTAN